MIARLFVMGPAALLTGRIGETSFETVGSLWPRGAATVSKWYHQVMVAAQMYVGPAVGVPAAAFRKFARRIRPQKER